LEIAMDVPESWIDSGWFAVPHYIYWLPLHIRARRLLFVLLKLENRYTTSPAEGAWFHASNEDLMELEGFKKSTLGLAREELVEKGFIKFIRGYSNYNSRYRILLRGYRKKDPIKTSFRKK